MRKNLDTVYTLVKYSKMKDDPCLLGALDFFSFVPAGGSNEMLRAPRASNSTSFLRGNLDDSDDLFMLVEAGKQLKI